MTLELSQTSKSRQEPQKQVRGTKSVQNSPPLQVKFTKTMTSARRLLGAVVSFARPVSLTKREIEYLNARTEELDLEGSVYDWTFLPDELIESGLSNLAEAVRGNATVFPWDGRAHARRCTRPPLSPARCAAAHGRIAMRVEMRTPVRETG
jgi:hypothetical protein